MYTLVNLKYTVYKYTAYTFCTTNHHWYPVLIWDTYDHSTTPRQDWAELKIFSKNSTDGRTDGRTDRRTDRPTWQPILAARSRLKNINSTYQPNLTSRISIKYIYLLQSRDAYIAYSALVLAPSVLGVQAIDFVASLSHSKQTPPLHLFITE